MLPTNQGKQNETTHPGRESARSAAEEKAANITQQDVQANEKPDSDCVDDNEQQISFTQEDQQLQWSRNQLNQIENQMPKTDAKQGNLGFSDPETPQQNEISEQDQLLNEQRQLSSIASFGQIQHNHNNTMSKYNGHFQNVSQFGEKNESLSSFNYVSGDRADQSQQMRQEQRHENQVSKEAHGMMDREYLDDIPGQQSDLESSEQKKQHQSVNSQGFNESAQNMNNDSNQFNSGAFQKSGYQIDSPSRQKANFLGEKIRMTHQQLQQQNQEGSQDLSSILIDNSNIFGGINEQTQNISSLVADLSAPQSNSFDQKNLHFQLNLDQKNRSKSSTKLNNNNSQISYRGVNSNHDSSSNLINQLNNPNQEINSPLETSDNQNLKFFGQNEINFQNINKQNSFQLGGQNIQSNTQKGPVISKQQIKYHKNAFTNRGESSSSQSKLQKDMQIHQNMLKLQQMQMQKHASYQQNSNLLRSPHGMTAPHQGPNTLNLILSAHSKNSNIQNPNFNNFTMRSLKSQNSGGTQGGHTNRGEQLSLQQKSPNMSEVQDPYAYFNMHQQHQSVNTPSGPSGHTVQVSVGGMNQVIGINKLDTKLMSASGSSHQVNFTKQELENGVKSCRPNLYSKQQMMISQRGMMQPQQVAIFGNMKNGGQVNLNQNINIDQNQLSDGQTASKEDRASQENMKGSHRQHQSPAGAPYVFSQNQIHFNQSNEARVSSSIAKHIQGSDNSGNHSAHYYNNTNNDKKMAQSYNKGMLGLMGSAGSGSHGSNFNSSTSTFPAAPVQKLSDVKNPQKLMSFRFVNRKATQIKEISLFKNLTELDLSGNMLQEQVNELSSLNFLKRISLCNNKIQDLWILPKSIEILNLSYNLIKKMPEDACKRLKNITTMDISNNKLETLENIQYMHRIKRLLAKNNFVRELTPLQSIKHIFELDLEGNAVDSHKDFLGFVKDKNDLIVVNLHQNPLMVEVQTIEKFNDNLIQNAPEMVTQKTPEEIEEIKELLGLSSGNPNPNDNSTEEKKSHRILDSTKGGEDTNGFYVNLIEELACCLNFLKGGVLYRNKRVFTKLKQIQLKSKRSASNYSNSSHSIVNTSSMAGGLKNNATLAGQQNFSRGAKEGGSTQDRHSAKLTPPSANAQNTFSRHSNACLPSSAAQGKLSQKNNLSNSAAYSPILSIKSQRYEDVEALYDNIVEQEELKRLKQKKMMAKKRQLKKKQLLSQLDGGGQGNRQNTNYDSDNNSSDYSDDDLDDDEDIDDLENLGDLDLMDRDDLDEDIDDSCMIDQDSGQMLDYSQQFGNYQHQHLHDEEVMSQTITSDLEADLHSYKRGDEHQDIDHYYDQHGTGDDRDYLNGSTAGFGKKLREINREINQEQQEERDDSAAINFQQLQPGTTKKQMQQFQSVEKEKSKKIDSNQIKIKTKFDLNLSKLQKDKNQKFVQSELKINIYDQKKKQSEEKQQDLNQREPIEGIHRMVHKKQVKTTQNSNENSQNSESQKNLLDGKNGHNTHGIGTIVNSNEDQYNYDRDQQQQLNQSFSLKNIQQNADNLHEVESLMMNQQIIQRGAQEALPQNEAAGVGNAVAYNAFQFEQLQVGDKQEAGKRKIMQGSMSQNLRVSNMLNIPNQSVNQSVNQSLLSESIAQSITSVTQNSKKIPNFKLDLSKCKLDDEGGDGFDEDDMEVLQKELKEQNSMSDMQINNYHLQGVDGSMGSQAQGQDQADFNNQSSKNEPVQLGDINILLDSNAQNIDDMKINVSDDGYRKPKKTGKIVSLSSNQMDSKDIGIKSPRQNSSSKKTLSFSQQKAKNKVSPEMIDKLRKSRDAQPEHASISEELQSKAGNKTVRNPTPAPAKPRTNNEAKSRECQQPEALSSASQNQGKKPANKTERIQNYRMNLSPDQVAEGMQVAKNNCSNCSSLEQAMNMMRDEHNSQMDTLKLQVAQQQQVLKDIKKYLNLTGQIDFSLTPIDKQGSKKNQTRSLNMSNFADKVHLMFRRMYADLEKMRAEKNKLVKIQKLRQNQIMQLKIGKMNSDLQPMDIKPEAQRQPERNNNDQGKSQKMQLKVPIIKNIGSISGQQDFPKIPLPQKNSSQRHGKKQDSMDFDAGDYEEEQKKMEGKYQPDMSIFGDSSRAISPAGSNKKQLHPQKLLMQHPKVYGKDKGILQIKMNDIQKPSMPSISSSEIQSALESNQSEDNTKREEAVITKLKKQAAKTMRNLPLSATEHQSHSTQQPQRVNSNPKLQIAQAAAGHQKKYEHIQYEANTFSSQYSLSQQQTVFHPPRAEDDHFDSKLLQDSLNDDSSQQNQHASSMQTSQLQLLSNGVKVLKQPNTNIKQSKQVDLNKGSKQAQQQEVIHHIQKTFLKNQSNTARTRGTGQKAGAASNQQLSKKQKSPVPQYQTNAEQTPNSQEPDSYKVQYLQQLDRSQRSMNKTLQGQNAAAQWQAQQAMQGSVSEQAAGAVPLQKMSSGNEKVSKLNHLQKSLEQIKKESSQQNNYKTSRIPMTNSKSFIEAANIQKMNLVAQDQAAQQNEAKMLQEEMPSGDFYSQIEHQNQSQSQNYNMSTSDQKFLSMNVFQNPLMSSTGNSASIQTEKRKQKVKVSERGQLLQIPQVLNVPAVQHNYLTQRKIQGGFKATSAGNNTNVPSVRPASRENKTQRIQRQQLLNKSGGQPMSLQQTYDQDMRGQSVNLSVGPNVQGMTVTTDPHPHHTAKRPQSVVESGGRKFQKIQQQMVVFNKLNQSSNTKQKLSKSKSKSKHKSSERNHSKQANQNSKHHLKNIPPNEASPSIDIDFKIQINNLNANIQNIQNIQNNKYNTSAKNQMHKQQLQQQLTQMSLTNRAVHPGAQSIMQMSKQPSLHQQISRQNSKQDNSCNLPVYTPLYQEHEELLRGDGSAELLECINNISNSTTGRRTTLPAQAQPQPQLSQPKYHKSRRRSNNFTNLDNLQPQTMDFDKKNQSEKQKNPGKAQPGARRQSYLVKTTRTNNYSTNQRVEADMKVDHFVDSIKQRNSSMENRHYCERQQQFYPEIGAGHQFSAEKDGEGSGYGDSAGSLDMPQDNTTSKPPYKSAGKNMLIVPH